MAATLPTNIDTTYPDGGDASFAVHKQHHDVLHASHNAQPFTDRVPILTADEVLTGACNGASGAINFSGVLTSNQAGQTIRADLLARGDAWIGPQGVDTTAPVADVVLVEQRATYNAAGDLTASVFDVDASGSTDETALAASPYAWDDGGAGGAFSSATVAAPTYTPANVGSGPWTLTCTVIDAAGNTNAAAVVVDVPTSGASVTLIAAGTLVPAG